MGTASTTKLLKNNAGTLTEETTLTTSAGAGDANKVPALNASGILDDSIINASATSSANKVVKMNASGIIDTAILNAKNTSAGAGDAGKVPLLDSAGRLDTTMMPVGIGQDTASIVASEALAAGDFVNVHNVTGTAKVRKADATVSGKEAHGFVLAAVTLGANANVFFEGTNTGVTSQTPGPVFLSATAGQATATPPTGTGKVVQRVGFAVSATAINFDAGEPIVLA